MADIQNNEQEQAVIRDKDAYNKKIKTMPKPKPQVGLDLDNTLLANLADAGDSSQIDMSALNNFLQISQRRDQLYNLLDSMAQDSIVSAILETYAEDATEYNDEGRIIWAESDDPKVLKLVTFMLDTMQVDKYAYGWAYSLCKYGDLYLQLFKQSEYDLDPIFDSVNKKEKLNEDIKVHAYKDSDKFVHYIEAVKNPAKIFELTRFGKTCGFIDADITTATLQKSTYTFNNTFTYKYRKNDVHVYPDTKFVHAVLDDSSDRTTEEVDLFLEDKSQLKDDEDKIVYNVRRGQSLLYNSFKIWRMLSLLENSMLLNRITKSSIVRLINVEVGDMPKEMVGPHLQGIKSMMEQKAAIDTDNYMTEYTNPGPIENNIYVPTRNGIGAITPSQIGGDVNITALPDIEYFQNKYFGSFRVPKQYFGLTEDGAGFNGGQSLSIISSRYAKMIKRIQNALIQAITNAINIMLIDKGLPSYVNEFTIKMQPPTTQEEIDRRDNISAKVGITSDIMNSLTDVEDPTIRLKILKTLLSNIVTDPEVINLIQEQIDKLEDTDESQNHEIDKDYNNIDSNTSFNLDSALGLEEPSELSSMGEFEPESDETLPSPEELGIGDLTDNVAQEQESEE